MRTPSPPPPPTQMYKGAACVFPFAQERVYLGRFPVKPRERGIFFVKSQISQWLPIPKIVGIYMYISRDGGGGGGGSGDGERA